MKFNRLESQPDPHVSLLDIVFCLCVVLCFALTVSSFKKNLSKEKENAAKEVVKEVRKEIVKEVVKNNGKVFENRFSGRGGQPKLYIVLNYDPENVGFTVSIGKLEFTYADFRKLICNIDRQESDGNPSFLFSAKLTDGYKKADPKDIYMDLNEEISMLSVSDQRSEDPNWWIVNLFKKKNQKLENDCRKFKLEYTSSSLGNWDSDRIEPKEVTPYDERREKGQPFIWFTVDEEKRRIVLGPKNDQVLLKPNEFVELITSIEGNDGLYLEYRDPETLRYNVNTKIPEWVMIDVIKQLGYGACSN